MEVVRSSTKKSDKWLSDYNWKFIIAFHQNKNFKCKKHADDDKMIDNKPYTYSSNLKYDSGNQIIAPKNEHFGNRKKEDCKS